jgi:hypothetical protein
MAEERFMLELADQVKPQAHADNPLDDVVSLTLAAYDADIEAVRDSEAAPRTNESHQYVLAIRGAFVPYQGVVPPLRTTSPSQQATEGQ